MYTSSLRKHKYVLNIKEITHDICYICSLMIMCNIHGATFATHLLHLQCHGTYIYSFNALVGHMYDVSDMNML